MYLVYVYAFLVVFYFAVSMSFVYWKSIGLSQVISLVGVMIAYINRSHFHKQYLKVKHLELVKNLVIDEWMPIHNT